MNNQSYHMYNNQVIKYTTVIEPYVIAALNKVIGRSVIKLMKPSKIFY